MLLKTQMQYTFQETLMPRLASSLLVSFSFSSLLFGFVNTNFIILITLFLVYEKKYLNEMRKK